MEPIGKKRGKLGGKINHVKRTGNIRGVRNKENRGKPGEPGKSGKRRSGNRLEKQEVVTRDEQSYSLVLGRRSQKGQS